MRRPWIVASVTGALLVFAALAVTLGIGNDRVFPGVRAAGTDLGGHTVAEARAMLASAASAFATTPVLVIDAGTVWPTTNSELGIELDVDRATSLALAVGREGAVADRLRDVARAVSAGVDIGWPRRSTDARLDAFVDHVASVVDQTPVDGAVAVAAGGVSVTPPVIGHRVDRALLKTDILGSRQETLIVALAVSDIEPSLVAADIADAAADATAAYAPLRIAAGSESITVDAARIAGVLTIVRDRSGEQDRLRVAVDDAALSRLTGEIADELDGVAREAELVPGGERLEVVAGRDAIVVDRSSAAAAIGRALFSSERLVIVPAVVTPPSLSTAQATQLAERLRLAGASITYFPLNEARRINIDRAARTFDGMVVGPGESFSFWDRIGEVSPRNGYTYAGAIIGGVSSTAIGGGLCQVSTTFFNAVASAGFRIDERHPHAYYIERYPLGLDAAVFAGQNDLRWTNDTAVPAYIRASATATSISFWIYSAPTGRVTSFSDPIEWNLRWPAPTQPADPAHAPGYTVLGRDVVVTRTVTEGGVVIHIDEFFSHYAPVWGGPAR